MHHPEQFSFMAKSIQDDKLRAAAANRAGKKARGQRFDWRSRASWLLRLGGFRQVVGRAAANVRQASTGFARAAFKDS